MTLHCSGCPLELTCNSDSDSRYSHFSNLADVRSSSSFLAPVATHEPRLGSGDATSPYGPSPRCGRRRRPADFSCDGSASHAFLRPSSRNSLDGGEPAHRTEWGPEPFAVVGRADAEPAVLPGVGRCHLGEGRLMRSGSQIFQSIVLCR